MQERLFVFGTLRFPKYQREAWSKTFPGKPATIRAYRRSCVLVNGKKYIVAWPDINHSVRGVVLSVSARELKMSDAYEDRYTRRKVTLADGSIAWMYQYKYKK